MNLSKHIRVHSQREFDNWISYLESSGYILHIHELRKDQHWDYIDQFINQVAWKNNYNGRMEYYVTIRLPKVEKD